MADAIVMDVEASGIYQIRNIENDKRYVGSAKCFRLRWNAHRANLAKGLHHSPHLQYSWNKHGPSRFAFEILEFCAKQDLIQREQFWIDSLNPEFNVCQVAGSTLGFKFSEETKAKISAKAKGRKFPPRSASYRAMLSAIHAGKPKPKHVMDALQRGRRATVYTDERRARLSESLRLAYADGRKKREKSEEHRSKIGKHFAKLTDSEVRQIRALRKGGITGRELARRYKSNTGTISAICSGKRYRWVV